jgi:hypothetical protein
MRFAVWLALCVVACSGARDPGPAPARPALDEVVPVPPPNDGVAPTPAPISTDYSAWDDPFPLAELAKDCAWQPAATPPERTYDTAHPMLCEKVVDQVCAMDACLQSDSSCYPQCTATCDGCAGLCIDGCETCKQGCRDDACRQGCAKSCAECRQGCLRELDQCTTGHCATVMQDCLHAQYEAWSKSTCDVVCPQVAACVDAKCPLEERWRGGACEDTCVDELMKPGGCPAEFVNHCMARASPPMPPLDP